MATTSVADAAVSLVGFARQYSRPASKQRRYMQKFLKKVEADADNSSYSVVFHKNCGIKIICSGSEVYRCPFSHECARDAYLALVTADFKMIGFMNYVRENRGTIPPTGLPLSPQDSELREHI